MRIEQFLYREALVLPEEGTRLLHLVFSPDGDGRCKLRLLSTEAETNAAWILHIEADVETDTAPVAPPRDLAAPQPGHAFEREDIAFLFCSTGLNIALIETDRKPRLIP